MPPPEPAPELPDPTLPAELLEEIFLRLPPDEPEWLVRASLASKLWLGRLTAPRFQARYSELHRAPPMLGFFYSSPYIDKEAPFVSTTKFRVCIPYPYGAWDCRHGRVLLGYSTVSLKKLAVLDPITGCRREVVAPGWYDRFGAAVLCPVNGCDHRACHAGPSRVVFVGHGSTGDIDVGLDFDDDNGFAVAYAHESLLETPYSRLRQWSEPSSGLHLGPDASIQPVPPVLIQDALYFMLSDIDDDGHMGILKYDLCSKCLSLIDVPLVAEDIAHSTILMAMEDGSLGFAHLDGLTLYLWSRQMGSDGVGSWTECRVVDFKEVLPFPMERLKLVGSMEGGDIIFVTVKLGTYEINLKSLEWKKIWKKECSRTLIPYMSFYYP